MTKKAIKIDESWAKMLSKEFTQPYFIELIKQLNAQKKEGIAIYPDEEDIFKAFNLTIFDEVKVIILGQDPYHNPEEAMGLCFSVPKNKRVPPSLRNIYKEIHQDLGCTIPNHGDLTAWAESGVLLLNSILTVQHKSPGSHRKLGWQSFTDEVIRVLSEQKTGLVFLLWGNYAKGKRQLIDTGKHHILESPHPSPLARGGFFNNKHFSQTNRILEEQNKTPIDWQINSI